MARPPGKHKEGTTDFPTDSRKKALSRAEHGITMAWPVTRCELRDGFVMARCSPFGWYNPFRFYTLAGSARESEGYHGLHMRLARLADGTDEEIVRFCSRYGLLHWPTDEDGEPLRNRELAVAYPISGIRRVARFLDTVARFLSIEALEDAAHALWDRYRVFLDADADMDQPAAWVLGEPSSRSCLVQEEPSAEQPGAPEPPDPDDEGPMFGVSPDADADVVEWVRRQEEMWAAHRADRSHRVEPVEWIELYWVGRPTDDIYALALQWDVHWRGDDLAQLTKSYWDEYYYGPDLPSLMDEYGPGLLTEDPAGFAQSLRDSVESALTRLGDPQARSYDSLHGALLGMLLRDWAGAGRFVVCEYCGKPFYARHGRRRYCPPDDQAGNPYGCAKLRADRDHKRRARQRNNGTAQ